jgi:1-acyl-sn-glycerol-3-phosphate acyltransferase
VRFRYRLSWKFTNFVARAFLGLKTEGAEHVPGTGGFILACNHVSNWDPPLVGSAVERELFYLAKEELFKNRIFAALIRAYNAIPLRRESFSRRTLEEAARVIKAGNAILIFPEGTRSVSGGLKEPRPGLGMLADWARCPIVPAYVTGSNTIMKCLIRRTPLVVSFGPPIGPEEFLAKGGEGRERYTRISRVAMDGVARLKARAERAA